MDSDAKAYQALRFELTRQATALVGPSEAKTYWPRCGGGSGAAGWPCRVEALSELHGYAGRSTKRRDGHQTSTGGEHVWVENKANEEETSCTRG